MNYDKWSTKKLRGECIYICKRGGVRSGWIKNARKNECLLFLNDGKKSARLDDRCKCYYMEHASQTNGCGLENITYMFSHSSSAEDSRKAKTPKLKSSADGLEGILINAVMETISRDVNDTISSAVEDAHSALMQTFENSSADILSEVEKKISELRKPLHITVGDKPTVKLDGAINHPLLPDVIEALHYRDKVLLVGKAGTGKSTMIKQASSALGYDTSGKTHEYVYMCGTAGVTEGHLTGRMLFNGEYRNGLAVPPFERGGVLCADEFDGFDENCALVFNAMLDDQGVLAIPNRPDNPVAIRHEKFKFAGCANTHCDGADFSYSGRNQLDRATLDRFGDVVIEVDYDKALERALIGEFSDTAHMLWSLRKNVERERIERIVSTRLFKSAQTWRKLGKSNAWFLERITTSWTAEEKDKVGYNDIVSEVK